MRLLVKKLLAPFGETGFDANIVRFLGSETAWNVVQRSLATRGAPAAADGASGSGSGTAAATRPRRESSGRRTSRRLLHPRRRWGRREVR